MQRVGNECPPYPLGGVPQKYGRRIGFRVIHYVQGSLNVPWDEPYPRGFLPSERENPCKIRFQAAFQYATRGQQVPTLPESLGFH